LRVQTLRDRRQRKCKCAANHDVSSVVMPEHARGLECRMIPRAAIRCGVCPAAFSPKK